MTDGRVAVAGASIDAEAAEEPAAAPAGEEAKSALAPRKYTVTRITKERGREVIRSGTCDGLAAFTAHIEPGIGTGGGEFQCYACDRRCMIRHGKIGVTLATGDIFMRFYLGCGLLECEAMIEGAHASSPDTVDRSGPAINACFHCRRKEAPGEKMKACARCTCVRYCNTACQGANWPHHKKHCKPVPAVPPA
jgi:hypothetical protein